MKRWESTSLSELESLKGPGTLRWSPVRRRFGITAFGINAYTAAEAGHDVVEEHTEQTLGHEELYAVVAGHARFTARFFGRLTAHLPSVRAPGRPAATCRWDIGRATSPRARRRLCR